MPDRIDSKSLIHSEVHLSDSSDLKFIYNDFSKNTKVITTLSENLRKCDTFDFSVAFITDSGIEALFNELRPFREGRKRGRILTTDYLNFNNPKALEKLLEFEGIETRIYSEENFHTKGYIFNKGNSSLALIGSSNLTQDALGRNKEWNILFDSSDAVISLKEEFEIMWEASAPLTEKWIEDYIPRYYESLALRREERKITDSSKKIKPNNMQIRALSNLDVFRKLGKNKALIISATGTGKTYLSAFDAFQFKPKKLLFLVHRDKILNDAIASYRKIFGDSVTYGKLTGNFKDYDSDFLFATTQSMSRKNNLERFEPDYFDYIVCDEAHRSAAEQYTRIISYFKPAFLLGMTATPERTDDRDIFGLFDYNIASDIRLKDALENNMVCPFHYFGITDITSNGEILDDNSDFNKLTSDERVNHIVREAESHIVSGDRLRGLIFCSCVDECYELSKKLNERGYRTVALSGSSSDEEREFSISRLESSDENALDFILTYDIFNEGIDIPSVNMVIMLRPTQSAIVFVQQLGRGLRKRDSKAYLVVLDFIGNYENNFLIAVALSGDRSYSKDRLRKFIYSGTSQIPGPSTINLDEISKERIFDSITHSDLNKKRAIRERYTDSVMMHGRHLSLTDLYRNNELDPRIVVKLFKNLNALQTGVRKFESPVLNNTESELLSEMSSEFISGLRPQELIILKELLNSNSVEKKRFGKILKETYSVDDEASLNSALNVLDSTYFNKKRFIEISGELIFRSEEFNKCLHNHDFKSYVQDVVECGTLIFENEYLGNTDDGLMLYSKYSRREIMRILNWDKHINEQSVGGYLLRNNTRPIFVTYNKEDGISTTVRYADEFIDPGNMTWFSKHPRKLDSPEIQKIIKSNELGIKNYLFVKKSDSTDENQFYYLGKAHVTDSAQDEEKNEDGVAVPVVRFKLALDTPVRQDLFEYITN